jgi:hypothetical protein
MRKRILIVLMLGLTLGLACPAVAVQVYFNDFSSSVGPGWTTLFNTPLLITTAPQSPYQKFLGTDKNLGISQNIVTFTQNGFNTYMAQGLTWAKVEFDLYIIHSWDGNNTSTDDNSIPRGPDTWALQIDGKYYVNTTFSNIPTNVIPTGYEQSYSSATPIGTFSNPPKTGSVATSSLTYDNYLGQYGTDTTYNFAFTVPLSGDKLVINFIGFPTQAISDESWGLDNVRVSAIPIPASAFLLGSGLIGLGLLGWRRKRS